MKEFSILGSVVFDFIWREFQVFYLCICLFLMNFPLAYESHINIYYAERSLCVCFSSWHVLSTEKLSCRPVDGILVQLLVNLWQLQNQTPFLCWYGRYILIYDAPLPHVYVAYAVCNPFGAAGISAEYKNDKKSIELSW